MEQRKWTEPNSSFDGFLDSYSKGNISNQSQLTNIYSRELDYVIKLLNDIIESINDSSIDPKVSAKMISCLDHSKEVLQPNEEPLMRKLITFIDDLGEVILIYKSLGSPPPSITNAFKKLIFNFLKIVKKINDYSVTEKTVSVVEEFEQSLIP